jgi:FAD binding domain/Berberine and berberine like
MPTSWRALEDAIDGEVVLPGAPQYETLRRPAIARFDDARPQAIVLCATPSDVAETISVARDLGVRAAPRSGGHCFAGRSSTEGIVIDVTPMRSVSVADGLVSVGAGARLEHVYDALDDRGLTIAAGCGPSVGIAGLTLGGGLGILGRKHGLTADQLAEAEVVLADGRIVACDEHRDEELFWALAGSGLGHLRRRDDPGLPDAPDALRDALRSRLAVPARGRRRRGVAGLVALGARRARRELADRRPRRPRPTAVARVFGAMLGSESETATLLEELVARVGADPASEVLEHGSYRETKRRLAEAGAEGGPHKEGSEGVAFSKSEFFRRPLPAEAIAALVDHFATGRASGEARELDFTPWGGAYNRVPAHATAFAHRDERFLLKHAVVVASDATASRRQAARRWLAQSWAAVHPSGTGRVYPNFPDPDLAEWATAYHGSNYDRLVRVKASYDPEGFFRFPQSVPAPQVIARPA